MSVLRPAGCTGPRGASRRHFIWLVGGVAANNAPVTSQQRAGPGRGTRPPDTTHSLRHPLRPSGYIGTQVAACLGTSSGPASRRASTPALCRLPSGDGSSLPRPDPEMYSLPRPDPEMYSLSRPDPEMHSLLQLSGPGQPTEDDISHLYQTGV